MVSREHQIAAHLDFLKEYDMTIESQEGAENGVGTTIGLVYLGSYAVSLS